MILLQVLFEADCRFGIILSLSFVFFIFRLKSFYFCVVFVILQASNGQKINSYDMEILDTAFAQMVKEHKSTIYTVCFMFSKDSDEVSDLFQEVLINLWKGYDSFKNLSNINTWIWKVSFNTCISCARKKKRRAAVPLTMDINLFEDKDENSRQIRLLYDRIHRLSPFDRAIVLLWLENMSYEEIGAIVGISTKNVSVRLYRIKEELKKCRTIKMYCHGKLFR